jgi:hypothetical protein
MNDFHTGILVSAGADHAFSCICSVSAWWTENMEGASIELHDEFTVRFGDVHYSKQRLTEVVPGKNLVWLVTEGRLNFVKREDEWTNSRIIFELIPQDGQLLIQFTHAGLNPDIECYGACSSAWKEYVAGSLYKLITAGEGQPDKKVA